MARVTGKSGMFSKLSSEAKHLAEQPVHEGKMTRKIEQQTAKIPSIGFLGLAVGSMVASAALAFFAQKKEMATFVGLWAPSLLLIGIYNKLVKMENEGGFGQRQGYSERDFSTEDVSGQVYGSQSVPGQRIPDEGLSGA